VDEMEEVTQRFEADMSGYLGELRAAADESRKFAEDSKAAGTAAGGLRDKIAEAAAALKIYRDEAGKLRDSSGSVITAAEAQALALKHIRDQALEAAWGMRELDKYEKRGLLSRILGGAGSLLGKIPGLLGGGSAAGGGGEGSPQIPGGWIGAAIASAPVWLPELNALVSGFAAAGAGAGAFYLLAHPAINNLMADVKGLDTANQALGIAQQKYLIDPTEKHAKALHEAQVTYQATYRQMGQDAGGAAAGVLKLHDEYVKLSNAFQPEAFKVFNGFLALANELLPHVAPFAKTFADAFSGLLGQAGKFAGGKGFTDWLSQFQKLEGPSITAIGVGVGHLAASFGKLLTNMSAKDVVNGINIAFSILNGTILTLSWVIKAAMDTWDIATGLWDTGTKVIRRGGHDVAAAFDAVRHASAALAHGVASDFDRQRHDVASLAAAVGHYLGDVVTFFRRLPGEIVSAVGNLGSLLLHAGESLISGLITGIENAIPGLHSVLSWVSSLIPSWKGPLEADAQMLVPHGMAIMQGLIRGMAAQLPALRSFLASAGGVIPGSLGGIGGAYAASAIAPAGSRATVNITANFAPGMQAYSDPRFLQYIQQVVQEATLRYSLNNPGNGLSSSGRL